MLFKACFHNMKLNLFNQDKLIFSIQEYLHPLENEFSEYKSSQVNIIFVDSDYIRSLNSQYREMNSVTDVLSFNIDAEELLGEVYICPEYIKTTHPEYDQKEETLRLIIHGILHLIGYDHKVELTDQTKNTEEMFVKQEQILQNIL